MTVIFEMAVLFFTKMLDNALSTAKTIFIQKNRVFLAGLSLAVSNFIYFKLTKDVVAMDGDLGLYVIALASGVGCWIAICFDNRFSKDKTYVNVIMSDEIEAMKMLYSFLAENGITCVATDSYTLDMSAKTLTITAYAETRKESELIDDYIKNCETKFKRVVENNIQRENEEKK